ncbi:MAG TPA: GatB/YqeY domain-containing protein, partial [Novosphingobium sp.]|nr:GatB/YqeY domain-containing protein [Novosphingobium sp.]
IEAIKAEVGATSIKDMGKVVAQLKARHGSQIDMGKASGLVKAALA